MTLDVHVVTHTHWDREWYQPHERFRQRLVALVDEVLADPPREGASFLLDGQAIVVEDYLAVRPDRAPEVSRLLAQGRIEAGPWYVLADELIPGGEALVRNLLLGRATLARHGASAPPVLYCPDSFGHPATLPELAAGFGMSLAIVWRGYGGARWPAGDTARWCGPSGAAVTLFHLPRSGYEHGASLPWQPEAAAERWARMSAELARRSASGVLLVLNGADHHALQPRLPEALAALAVAALPDVVRRSSLSAFARAHLARARNTPEVRGELRDSYGYTWTLGGTLGSRAYQKRDNARAERALVREAEPWAALVALRGGTRRRAVTAAAWRSLLAAHPHDTLCGCSIDDVARAMDVRMAAALAQADGLRADAVAEWVGHDAAAARERMAEWRPVVIVRNAAARPRGGVAVLDVVEPIAPVPVGPGSTPDPSNEPSDIPASTLDDAPGVQVLSSSLVQHRTDSPRHYPRNELARRSRVLAWLEPVSGYGTRTFTLDDAARPAESPTVRATRNGVRNDALVVQVSADGEVSLEQRESGRTVPSLIVLEDVRDAGDLYTPAPRETAARIRFAGARVQARGPLRGEILLRWRLESRAKGAEPSALSVRLILDAGAEFLRVHVEGSNQATDHRLRIGFRTGLLRPKVWADAAFGPVHRQRLEVSESDARMEQPVPTAPLHRYVSLFGENEGATIFSDGLAEYETTDDGTTFVTLVRAVGELSRNDIPERPGHAGWPAPTPLAQCLGPFDAEFAVLFHGPRTPETIHRIECVADDVLLPLVGQTVRDAIHTPAPTFGVELEGTGLALLAVKETEDQRGVALRCVNLLDEPCRGTWRVGPAVHEVSLARLDETSEHRIDDAGATIPITAGPREVVTMIVRRRPAATPSGGARPPRVSS